MEHLDRTGKKWLSAMLAVFVAAAVFLGIGDFLIVPGTLTFLNVRAAMAADDQKPEAPKEAGAADGGGKAEQQPEAGAPCPECPPCPDPAKVVLSGLQEKKKRLASEEEQLKQERKALEQFKEELDERLTELETLKKQIDADLALMDKKKTDQELQQEAEFEATMSKLVKMYSGMKPKDAAVIINKMDLDVARQIFSRMRESSSSQILGYVDSDKAAKISESIVYRK